MLQIIINAKKKLDSSPLAERFYNGAVWSVASSGVTSVVMLALMIGFARALEKEIYGQFVLLQTTLNMIGVFAGAGIGNVVIKYASELKIRNTQRLGRVLFMSEMIVIGVSLVFIMTLLSFSGLISKRFLGDISLSTPLVFSSLSILLIALDAYQKSVLIGLESMRAYGYSCLIGVSLGAPCMYLLALNYGLNGAAVSVSINALILSLISRYKMNQVLVSLDIKKTFRGCLAEAPLIWKYALPSLIASSMLIPAHWMVQTFLAKTDGGYNQIAMLGISMQWFNLLIFIPATTSRILFPMFSDLNSTNDNFKVVKLLWNSTKFNFVLVLPVVIFIILFSDYFVNIYGVKYEDIGIIIKLAALTAFIVSLQMPFGALINGTGRMWLGVTMNLFWVVIYICMASKIIDLGAVGVMIAMLVAYVLLGLLTITALIVHKKILIK